MVCARGFLHEKRVRASNFGNRHREIVGDRAPFGGLSEGSQGLFRGRWGEAKIKICSISFAWGFQGGQFPLDLTQESKNSTHLCLFLVKVVVCLSLQWGLWRLGVGLGVERGEKGGPFPPLSMTLPSPLNDGWVL